MAFLTHYQLPIHYERGTRILNSFKHTKANHISNHIHEWRRRRCLIKLNLPDQLLVEWFMKSFVNKISHDISMGGIAPKNRLSVMLITSTSFIHRRVLFMTYSLMHLALLLPLLQLPLLLLMRLTV
jgi:hypothetical protein